MRILLQKSGILTTVQDLGRQRYRRFGINPGGVMDTAAARLANILLANDECTALLEMHFPAPQIMFEQNTIASICGADFAAELDGKPVENWRPFFASNGSELKFTAKTFGNRAYLAVKGGLTCDPWLGSSSTNLAAKTGGFEGRKLEPGDRIDFDDRVEYQPRSFATKISSSMLPLYRPFPTVRIVAGAEFGMLGEKDRELFQSQDFAISRNSNRMGFRLSGEPLTLRKPLDFVSSAMCFGTIQLLPDGQLIVLMADHQTAGGYPRIGHVIARDLPLIGQLGAGDKVAFHLVDVGHAEDLAAEFERDLNLLRIACKFQSTTW